MTVITHNGVFPRGSLTPIPGGFLAKGEVAQSWLAMYKAARAGGVTLRPAGSDSSARSVDRQRFWRAFWCSRGHCEKAADPGTSNHGWAKAVDVFNANNPSSKESQWLRAHAHEFGWTNDEGAGVGEPWHWGYVGGFKPKPSPLRFLPKHMQIACERLLYHRGQAIAEARSGKGPNYKKQVKWREFWARRVEGMLKRAHKTRNKAILRLVLHDRDGVI